MDGDYYTGEYDYTPVDKRQPETPTETTGQGQVTFFNVVFFPTINQGLNFSFLSTGPDKVSRGTEIPFSGHLCAKYDIPKCYKIGMFHNAVSRF